MSATPELLAPAGGPDAGYAALHYGADAVYLGLSRFSARAEAENFSPEQLGEFVDYAHSLQPRRKVYLTLNTLLKDDETAAAAETLLIAAERGVDAVIVQDLGAAALARRHFPALELHASTQMAIHNLEGVLAARDLGFGRVTLARELTLAELARLVAGSGVELEVFIHGTLCYSYSGLCLFSSLATGRSGNRGRCVYSCRDSAALASGTAHPFSLKDLALGRRILDLARAGIKSLKIEGRKKSPLYVAATVAYYRAILDGKQRPEEDGKAEAGLKTIFARPWTKLFLDSRRNPEAADPEVVGHRGARIGMVERVARTPAGQGVFFTPDMAVERHDGLQIDVPGLPRPFGFPVDNLYAAGGGRLKSTFQAEAGAPAAVALPNNAPPLATGLPLYLASSQRVKRSFPFSRPRPGAFGFRLPYSVELRLEAVAPPVDATPCRCRVTCLARLGRRGYGVAHTAEEYIDAFPARDPGGAEQAARNAFERSGDAMFRLDGWAFHNPGRFFLKPGVWNDLRRRVLAELERAWNGARAVFLASLSTTMGGEGNQSVAGVREEDDKDPSRGTFGDFRWHFVASAPGQLAHFTSGDFAFCDEVTVEVNHADASRFREGLSALAERAGSGKIRLSLPLIARDSEERALAAAVASLWDAGWRRWLAPGLAGWRMLRERPGVDLAADWPLFVLNRVAAGKLMEMGFSRFSLSPEDDASNMAALLRDFAEQAVATVYAYPPLFISAACVHAHIGVCPVGGHPKGGVCGKPLVMRLAAGGEVEVRPARCGSVVVGAAPLVLTDRLPLLWSMGARRLAVDWRWKDTEPGKALESWRGIRNGDGMEGISGNFQRGLI